MSRLQNQVLFQRARFCSDFDIPVSSCDIVSSGNVKLLRKFVNDCSNGSVVKLSFETREGKLTQLSMMREKHCIIFCPGLISELSKSPALPILKQLFENRAITKSGENSWLLILIILKHYEIRSRAFRAIGMLQRKHKPLTDKKINPTKVMFYTARMLMATFNNSYQTRKESKHQLNVTSGNEKALKPVLNHLVEIDLHKSELLQKEWVLRAKSTKLNDDG